MLPPCSVQIPAALNSLCSSSGSQTLTRSNHVICSSGWRRQLLFDGGPGAPPGGSLQRKHHQHHLGYDRGLQPEGLPTAVLPRYMGVHNSTHKYTRTHKHTHTTHTTHRSMRTHTQTILGSFSRICQRKRKRTYLCNAKNCILRKLHVDKT